MTKDEQSQKDLPYTWKQTLQDVDVTVPVPSGTKSKQLNIQILKKKLVVGIKGEAPIIDGELCQSVKLEDSTWLLGKL
jgi:HSP20 family molecular chaperone IbpA